MEEHINLFEKPMTKQEQLELSNLLDKFLILYENNFDGMLDEDDLLYEFEQLYEMVNLLSNRAER